MTVAYLGGAFLLALALSLYLTPFVRRGALSLDVLDRPTGAFKEHREPVPYLGGIAVYVAFLIALSLLFEFSAELLGLLLGATLVLMLGLFDDMRVIPPRVKLAGQLLATWAVLRSDISIQLTYLPTWLAIPLTVLWLVGTTNALNILDVSDGLCTGVSAIAAAGLAVIAIVNGDLIISVTMLALAGALTGFLPFNWAPARIYLGDAGSLFVGFTLAAVALAEAYTQRNVIAAFAPLAILIVPILEITLVVIARIVAGRSPFAASYDHFAVRLRRRGWSAARIALAAYLVGATGSTLGVAMVWASPHIATYLAGAGLTLFFVLLALLLKQPAQPCEKIDCATRPAI